MRVELCIGFLICHKDFYLPPSGFCTLCEQNQTLLISGCAMLVDAAGCLNAPCENVISHTKIACKSIVSRPILVLYVQLNYFKQFQTCAQNKCYFRRYDIFALERRDTMFLHRHTDIVLCAYCLAGLTTFVFKFRAPMLYVIDLYHRVAILILLHSNSF